MFILYLVDGIFEVVVILGDNKFGGDDFDYKIYEFLVVEFKKEYGIDLLKDKMVL